MLSKLNANMYCRSVCFFKFHGKLVLFFPQCINPCNLKFLLKKYAVKLFISNVSYFFIISFLFIDEVLQCVTKFMALITMCCWDKVFSLSIVRNGPDHLTCLLQNLYAGQKTTARTRHGAIDWFQIGNGVHQVCILSPCLFNFYAGYIMWYVGPDKSQTGIMISGRNINNLRYADHTTLMAKTEDEKMKSLLMKVKEEF